MKTNRYLGIDLVRTFAAIWVAIFHWCGGFGYFNELKHPYENLFSGSKPGFFAPFIRIGFIGVPIFFMISGFVIVMSSNRVSPSVFVIKRFSRLIPAYILSLASIFLCWTYAFKLDHTTFMSALLLTPTMANQTYDVRYLQGSYWSLFPEITFYLFFCGILFFSHKRYFRNSLLFCVFWMLGAYYFSAKSEFLSTFFMRNYAIYFIFGATLAILSQAKAIRNFLPLIFVQVSLVIFEIRRWVFAWDAAHGSDWRVATAIFLLATAIILRSQDIIAWPGRAKRVIQTLGQATYSFYLLQEVLGMSTISFLVVKGLNLWAAMSVAFCVVGLTSVLFTIFVERTAIIYIRTRLELGYSKILRNDSKNDEVGF